MWIWPGWQCPRPLHEKKCSIRVRSSPAFRTLRLYVRRCWAKGHLQARHHLFAVVCIARGSLLRYTLPEANRLDCRHAGTDHFHCLMVYRRLGRQAPQRYFHQGSGVLCQRYPADWSSCRSWCPKQFCSLCTSLVIGRWLGRLRNSKATIPRFRPWNEESGFHLCPSKIYDRSRSCRWACVRRHWQSSGFWQRQTWQEMQLRGVCWKGFDSFLVKKLLEFLLFKRWRGSFAYIPIKIPGSYRDWLLRSGQ